MSRVLIDAQAPDFVLPDFNGQEFSLKMYRSVKHVLLVFNRGLT
jgi:peroxiredoxin